MTPIFAPNRSIITILFMLVFSSCARYQLPKTQLATPQLNYGVIVQDLAHKRPIQTYAANHNFIPASSLKVVTALSALAELKPSYRFTTPFYRFKNSLAVHFQGDPSLKTGDLLTALEHIAPLGSKPRQVILLIEPSIMAAHAETTELGDLSECYAAAHGNAILDHNCVADKGELKALSLAALEPHMIKRMHVALRGVGWSDVPISIHHQGPETGAELVYTHYSEPLNILLIEAMKASDNLIMDSIYLRMLAQSGQTYATWAEGGAYIKALVERHYGLELKDAVIMDGSGLSRQNLLRPEHLAQLLIAAQKRLDIWPDFLASLPIAGLDGTLSERLLGHGVTQVRAKTGSMAGISSLVGVARDARGRERIFVVMMNQFVGPQKVLRDMQDAWLIQFSR